MLISILISFPSVLHCRYDAGAFWAASGVMDLVRPDDKSPAPRYPGGFGDHATSQSLLAGIALALFHSTRCNSLRPQQHVHCASESPAKRA